MVRAILLGTTGIAKSDVAEQLRRYHYNAQINLNVKYVDFESEYIKPQLRPPRLSAYLDEDEFRQREFWGRAWDKLLDDIANLPQDVHLLLGLHATVIRPLYGVRSPIDISRIERFGPSHLITLIDDIYDVWHRTTVRAGSQRYVGVPTLSDLLEGRRSDLLIGDLIASHSSPDVKNWLLATKHPARTLHRLLFLRPHELKTVYLSFPISEPRRMQRGEIGKHTGLEPSNSGVGEINGFLRRAAELDREDSHSVMFCPLTIDELPLTRSENLALGGVTGETDNEEVATFVVPEYRWDLSAFYEGDLLISGGPQAGSIQLPLSEINRASGMIDSDVGRRDYRLVAQANNLVVFNPVMNQIMPRGVRNEVLYASQLFHPTQVFQDPAHDPGHLAEARFAPPPGQMGGEPGAEYVTFHESYDAALRTALE